MTLILFPDEVRKLLSNNHHELLQVMIGIISVTIFCFAYFGKYTRSSKNGIPYAKGDFIPLLGHALSYKRDSVSFLQRQNRLVGPIFRVNLAGKKMILLVSSDDVMKKISRMPDFMLSSSDALISVGFEQTLGSYNLHHGTEYLKRLIKTHFKGYHKLSSLLLNGSELPTIMMHMEKSLDETIKGLDPSIRSLQPESESMSSTNIIFDDLLLFVRNWHLRFVMSRFLGQNFTEDATFIQSLIQEFQKLQDSIEEATAAATVLPWYISKPFILLPVERARVNFQQKLSQRLEMIYGKKSNYRDDDNKNGPWIRSFKKDGISTQLASELIVGLLFAAAKNPAIASTQSFLLLLSEGTQQDQQTALEEAKLLIQDPSAEIFSKCTMLRKCVFETLRFIAHPIGSIRLAKQKICIPSSDTANGQEIIIERGEFVAESHITVNRCKQIWGSSANEVEFHRNEWDQLSNIPDEYKLTTFSHGTHRCPGSNIALLMTQCSLALLLSSDIKVTDEIPNLSFERATLAQRTANISFQLKI